MGRNSYKAVENKILPTYMSGPRIIIYDDESIQYLVGNGAGFEWEPQHMYYESVDGTRTPIEMGVKVTLGLNNAVCKDNITLDDTLMKRIAKFNKEQECKILDAEIQEKKDRIKYIRGILEDNEKRLDKLKKFVANIYDIDINDDDDDDWDD